MKIIRVPYSKNVQSILDSIITTIAVCGIVFMILAIIKLDWKAFLIGGIITIPTSIYTWRTMTLQILIWTKDFIQIKIIQDVNDMGFTLYHNEKETKIHWEDIRNIELKDDNFILVRLKNGKEIKIDNEYSRWYSLLKKIPSSKLESKKIPYFLERVFSNLETCKICGSIAMNKKKCLSCGSDCFNNELKEEFKNEIDYIKSEQLELFCTDDKDEKVEFYENEKDGFERDKNWKPIVSEKEVIEFSKINYWD